MELNRSCIIAISRYCMLLHIIRQMRAASSSASSSSPERRESEPARCLRWRGGWGPVSGAFNGNSGGPCHGSVRTFHPRGKAMRNFGLCGLSTRSFHRQTSLTNQAWLSQWGPEWGPPIGQRGVPLVTVSLGDWGSTHQTMGPNFSLIPHIPLLPKRLRNTYPNPFRR